MPATPGGRTFENVAVTLIEHPSTGTAEDRREKPIQPDDGRPPVTAGPGERSVETRQARAPHATHGGVIRAASRVRPAGVIERPVVCRPRIDRRAAVDPIRRHADEKRDTGSHRRWR